MEKEEKPYIGPDKVLPEITVKAVLLGALLSAILAGANAYLGLFAGMTVSASIPAAVISMAVLKLFKKHNILENNIVQTAASAGESVAAGIIFTVPALVLMGYWTHFNYWETALIGLCGGILGVFFTVPLRKALIVKQKLKFPEGVATSEVLKTGEQGGKAVKFLALGGALGILVKFAEAGLKLWEGAFVKATMVSQKTFLYFSMNLSPALIAVGYIVGVKVALVIFAGGIVTWWIGIPIYLSIMGNPEGLDAVTLGSNAYMQVRYLGVGAMVVGGLWALVNLRGAIGVALNEGLTSFKSNTDTEKNLPRTERDTPMKWIIIGIGVLIVPIFIMYIREIENVAITGLMAIIMVIAGFLFASVAGYMAGLVGSSNNPISGVTIATILTSSLILLALMGTGSEKGPAAAILIGSVVACAAAIAGDNMQDLKAGQVLGATPQKQQVMQMVGVVAAALVLPFVLELLNATNGFGPKTIENPDSLTAPQASLMQSVAEGVFGGGLPWGIISIGMALAVVVIIIDKMLETRNATFRIPVLALAIGIYLPFELDSAIMLGGIIAWLIVRYQNKHQSKAAGGLEVAKQRSSRTGLLLASGLITGEALTGIFLAFPAWYYGSTDALALMEEGLGSEVGLLVTVGICFLLYRIAVKAFAKE